MEEITLWVIDPRVSLREGLRVMWRAGQSAVVVDHGDSQVLLTAADITRAMNEPGADMVGRVEPAPPLPSPPHPAGLLSDQMFTSLPGMPSRPDHTYQLLPRTGATVKLLTMSVRFAGLLSAAPPQYYCDGPPPDVHTVDDSQITDPGWCPRPHITRTALHEIDGA